MPLLDHFHPPLYPRFQWASFHTAWIAYISESLNRILPPGYIAAEENHAGANHQIDVATFEDTDPGNGRPAATPPAGGVAVATRPTVWAPPAATSVVPAVFSDDFELRVISERDNFRLVAALELVSPANKDRPESRRAFAAKVASYLYQGVSVVVVDVVTNRSGSLHESILSLIGDPPAVPSPGELYAVVYRPIRRRGRDEIEMWTNPLAVGAVLPTLPLWLSAVEHVPVELEATYTRTRELRRIPDPGPRA